MRKEKNTIPETFIDAAVNILGDTNKGLSGSEIARYLSEYAYKYEVDIPYSLYPFPRDGSVPNKRYALKRNLEAFSSEQQYVIIKELCELDKFKGNQDVKELKLKLIKQYGYLYTKVDKINEELIKETKHWLETYPEVLEIYEGAIEKFKNGIYERNLLDDLRLALELLLKKLLANDKSLENQLKDIGAFLKENGVSKEFTNMFRTLLNYFANYQNTYVKHNNNVNTAEIEFVFDITSSFMKFLIKYKK